MSLSPLATHLMETRGFESIGEAILFCAINSTPALFREKQLLEVNNRIHDAAVLFAKENRLYKAVFTFRHEWDYKDYHWNRIIRLIPMFPEVAQAVFKYQAHNTLLARLISNKAPARVISALLQVAPEHVSVNFCGINPLHTACREKLHGHVIDALLSVPSGVAAAAMPDKEGLTPLHHIINTSYTPNPYTLYVVKALLAANPTAANMKTNTGWTPLSLTTIRQVSPEVKEALKKAMDS